MEPFESQALGSAVSALQEGIWDVCSTSDAQKLRRLTRLRPRPYDDEDFTPGDMDIDMLNPAMDLAKSAALHLPGDASILHLIDDNVSVMAGTSKGEIHALEWRESGLAHMHVMEEHTAAIRGLAIDGNELYSASEDGSVIAWDLRSRTMTRSYTHHGKAGLSAVSAKETLLAAGADDGTLLFWDPRSANLRASFHDTHPEAVTQICFPESSNGAADWMISSSADGFINVMDLKDGLDEDDAFRAALNSTPAVSQCGTYGPGQAKLWALSQIETLHLWDWHAAADEEVPGGEGTFADDLEVRKSLAAAQLGRKGQPEPHALVGMHASEGSLMLASTSAEGDVAVFRVAEPEAPAPGSSPAYAPAVNLKGGHKDVVRTMIWPGGWAQRYVTAGDDGTVALWQIPSSDASAAEAEPESNPRSKKRLRRG